MNLLNGWRPQPLLVALVSRAKLSGVGRHYGVYVRYGPFWDEVVDLQAVGGIRVISLTDFAAGRSVTTESVVQGASPVGAAWRRAREVITSPPAYDVLQRNCEHLARWIIAGTPKSVQVSSMLAVAALGLCLVMIASAR